MFRINSVLTIGGIDGSAITLNIERDDDPRLLALQFIDAHGLPRAVMSKLAAQIEAHINQAVLLLDKPSERVHQEADERFSDEDEIEQNFSRLLSRSYSQKGTEAEYYNNTANTPKVSVPDVIKEFSPVTNLEQSFYKARDTWSMSNKQAESKQKELFLTLKKSKSESNLSTGVTASMLSLSDGVSTPNRPRFERMYSEASLSKLRREKLKDQVEQERLAEIRNSSFMYAPCSVFHRLAYVPCTQHYISTESGGSRSEARPGQAPPRGKGRCLQAGWARRQTEATSTATTACITTTSSG